MHAHDYMDFLLWNTLLQKLWEKLTLYLVYETRLIMQKVHVLSVMIYNQKY